jgi:hypothetical protein
LTQPIAGCGCPIPPEVASGEVQSLGWHLLENHPDVPSPEELARRSRRRLRLLAESWDELCPNGARRFYEGDEPGGFRAEMIDRFGFDPAADDPEFPPGGWCEEREWAFTIPAGLVEEIYGNPRYPLGS